MEPVRTAGHRRISTVRAVARLVRFARRIATMISSHGSTCLSRVTRGPAPVRLLFEPIRPRFSIGGRCRITGRDVRGRVLVGSWAEREVLRRRGHRTDARIRSQGQVEWLYGHVDLPFDSRMTGPFVLKRRIPTRRHPVSTAVRCGPFVPKRRSTSWSAGRSKAKHRTVY